MNYVGGGSSQFTQTFSDWKTGYTGAGTTAPGESIAVHMTSYNTSSGDVISTALDALVQWSAVPELLVSDIAIALGPLWAGQPSIQANGTLPPLVQQGNPDNLNKLR